MENYLKAFKRRKPIDLSFVSPLRRCLKFIDLILLGIGGSVDVALYVVLGNVIRDIAGAATIVSMLVGFLSSLGAGYCYAEFASYIPTSGSDYDYVYSSLGELWGFLDGWFILLASVIATAALAQGAGDLFNSLTDYVPSNNIDKHVSLIQDNEILAANLNIVALIIVILVTIITAIGVQGSVRFNDCIVVINLLIIVFTSILGLCYANPSHSWSSWEKFAPYGVLGIVKSLPFTIFFYGGFISVTFSTEEVIDPVKNLPRSIISSIFGIFICFMAFAIMLSLVTPYNQLPKISPVSDIFGKISFKASKYIIAFGGSCSCLSSVLTACYANSRLSYVMSRDGLLMPTFGKVNMKTLVPINAVVITGIIAGILAAFCNLTILVEVCSLLVLIPYFFLGYAVMSIRYKKDTMVNISKDGFTVHELEVVGNKHVSDNNCEQQETTENGCSHKEVLTESYGALTQSSESNEDAMKSEGDSDTGAILSDVPVKLRINISLLVISLSTFGFGLLIRLYLQHESEMLLYPLVIFILPYIVAVLVICKTPYNEPNIPFKMPWFPFTPIICMTITIFVMVQFSLWSWVLLIGFIITGLLVYIFYGTKHSQLQLKLTTYQNRQVVSGQKEVVL